MLRTLWTKNVTSVTPKNVPKSQNSRFSLDIATLDHHCSQTSNAMTKWLGRVVHLHVKKPQLRRHVYWRYGVASRVSQSRRFRPKNRKNIFSRINSESSKTYRKSLLKVFWIFFEFFSTWAGNIENFSKSKKYFLLKSTQNLLERIENHFKFFWKKKFNGWDKFRNFHVFR